VVKDGNTHRYQPCEDCAIGPLRDCQPLPSLRRTVMIRDD
jgi:hypothetical protein